VTQLLICGDPHGHWKPLLRAFQHSKPGEYAAVVLAGDCDLERPLTEVLAPIYRTGTPVYWILGNHDTNKEHWYRNLLDCGPGGDIGGRVVDIGGLRVAGLGGTPHDEVWTPVEGDEAASFGARQEMLEGRNERWEGGLPLPYRSALWQEDILALYGETVDILVTHAAPSTHPKRYGYVAIDDAVADTGARLLIHGHNHKSESYTTRDGVPVRSLEKAEVLRLTMEPRPTLEPSALGSKRG